MNSEQDCGDEKSMLFRTRLGYYKITFPYRIMHRLLTYHFVQDYARETKYVIIYKTMDREKTCHSVLYNYAIPLRLYYKTTFQYMPFRTQYARKKTCYSVQDYA